MTSRHARRVFMPECIGRVVEVQYLPGFACGIGACAAIVAIMLHSSHHAPHDERRHPPLPILGAPEVAKPV